MSKTYFEKLQDPRWQRARLEIMERDDFTCRDCGDSKHQLHVHHCGYYKNPWDVPAWMLMTVCDKCHKVRQELEDRIRLKLACFFHKMSPRSLAELDVAIKDPRNCTPGTVSLCFAATEEVADA